MEKIVMFFELIINIVLLVITIKILYGMRIKHRSYKLCDECIDNGKHGAPYCILNYDSSEKLHEYRRKRVRLFLYEKRSGDNLKKISIPYWIYKESFDSCDFLTTENRDKWICEAILYYRYRFVHKYPRKDNK